MARLVCVSFVMSLALSDAAEWPPEDKDNLSFGNPINIIAELMAADLQHESMPHRWTEAEHALPQHLEAPMTTTPESSQCDYSISPDMNLQEMIDEVDRAPEDSIICVNQGVYTGFVDGMHLPLKTGQKLKGVASGDGRPIFDATAASTKVRWNFDQVQHVDLTFTDIHFKNIFLAFGKTELETAALTAELGKTELVKAVKNIKLYNLKFSHGKMTTFVSEGTCSICDDDGNVAVESVEGMYDKGSKSWGGPGDKEDKYIDFKNVGCSNAETRRLESDPDEAERDEESDVWFSTGGSGCSEIKGCDLRRSENHKGRGIVVKSSEGIVISHNTCGGDNVEVDGYFTTCLNMKGDHGVVFRNTFRRSIGTDDFEQDHGIYIKSTANIWVRENFVGGWMSSPSGGAIKLDSVQDIYVQDNVLVNSGVIVYDNKAATKNLWIRGNRIYVDIHNLPQFPFVKNEPREAIRGIGISVKGYRWVLPETQTSQTSSTAPPPSPPPSDCCTKVDLEKVKEEMQDSGKAIRISENQIWGEGNAISVRYEKRIWDADTPQIGLRPGGVYDNEVCKIETKNPNKLLKGLTKKEQKAFTRETKKREKEFTVQKGHHCSSILSYNGLQNALDECEEGIFKDLCTGVQVEQSLRPKTQQYWPEVVRDWGDMRFRSLSCVEDDVPTRKDSKGKRWTEKRCLKEARSSNMQYYQFREFPPNNRKRKGYCAVTSSCSSEDIRPEIKDSYDWIIAADPDFHKSDVYTLRKDTDLQDGDADTSHTLYQKPLNRRLQQVAMELFVV